MRSVTELVGVWRGYDFHFLLTALSTEIMFLILNKIHFSFFRMKLFIFLATVAVLSLVDDCDAWFWGRPQRGGFRRGSLSDSRSRSQSNNNQCPKPRFGGCDTTSCSGGQCLPLLECSTTSTFCAVSIHFCHVAFFRIPIFATDYGSNQEVVDTMFAGK